MQLREFYMILVFGFGILFSDAAWAQTAVDELNLPVAISLEKYARLDHLSPHSNLPSFQMSQEGGWRKASARSSVPIMRRQAIWPVYVETEDGLRYWGEITRSDEDSLDLLNRKTNQTITLAYESIRGIGLARTYPRSKPASAAERRLENIGNVTGTIFLIPVRILELFLVPQC